MLHFLRWGCRGLLIRLKQFIREFLPLLRYLRLEPDLLIVTADEARGYVYERLQKGHRAIHKLGLGELSNRIKTYCVKPPVASIAGLTWPAADEHGEFSKPKTANTSATVTPAKNTRAN